MPRNLIIFLALLWQFKQYLSVIQERPFSVENVSSRRVDHTVALDRIRKSEPERSGAHRSCHTCKRSRKKICERIQLDGVNVRKRGQKKPRSAQKIRCQATRRQNSASELLFSLDS
jgi:hypothetical protein